MIALIFGFIVFILASIVCFTLPGLVIIKRLEIFFTKIEFVFLATVVGFVFFTLLSYLLYILNGHFALLPIILALDFYVFKTFPIQKKFNFSVNKSTFLLLAIFTIGIAGQLAIIAPSGLSINGDYL